MIEGKEGIPVPLGTADTMDAHKKQKNCDRVRGEEEGT
jgi:hypothetical protein